MDIMNQLSCFKNHLSNICWDNIDLNEETPSGLGKKQSTHCITIQEISDRSRIASVNIGQVKISRQTTVISHPPEMIHSYAKTQVGPNLKTGL